MSNKIKHSGIIESVEDDLIKVRIVQTSACASCSVAANCNASEKKDKIVDVYNFDSITKYHTGDVVTLTASTQTGMNAVLLAFGIPFLIVVVTLFLMISTTDNEVLSAIVSILMLIPYYIALYFKRDKLRERLSFGIEDNL
jgi:sigma-E factor negative regulatory protein RseC